MKLQPQTRRFFEVLEVRRLLSLTPNPPEVPPVTNPNTLAYPALTEPYTPDEVRSAYGVDNITFGPSGGTIKGSGLGETIALIESGDDPFLVNTFALPSAPYVGWASSDLEIFDEKYFYQGLTSGGAVGSFNGDITNIIPNLTVVGQTGGARPLYSTDPASQAEDKQQAEDVEWAHAMAPEANLVLIEGLGEGSESVSMAATVGVEAVGAQVAMIRYTSDDQIVPGISESDFDQPGITFVAAAGNSGKASNDGPGDYPDVVDVGATDLTVNNDQFTIASGADTGTYAADSYNSEVGWSNPAAGVSLNTNTGGSSGGYALFPTPTYQQGLVISDGNQTLSNDGERTTPDVSFAGGSDTSKYPFDLIVSGTTKTDGGTEMSAAAFAGLIAIADQGITESGFDSLTATNYGGDTPLDSGQTLAALYGIGSSASYDYHDITSGFNGYAAGPGYDLVTGLGSPIANQLVPDLARAAPSLETSGNKNVIYAALDYEAPEAYTSSGGVVSQVPNKLTLELNSLNGTMIDIYDNTGSGSGLGTLVASDPLASTSLISINGGAFTTNTLTINFTNGNMIPAGGLTFDGTNYVPDDAANHSAISPDNDSTAGIPSLVVVGKLPTGSSWTSETDRPLSPTSGFITLTTGSGTPSNISYLNFENPGTAGAPAIIDSTPASNVSYIALGSNNDTVTLSSATVNGVQYSTYLSTGSTAPLFTPTDFINKTAITVADADGNDTLLINFNGSNPLPAAGLTFNGGTGVNTVKATGGGNFTLGANATITNTTLGGGGLSLLNEQSASLTGNSGNQYFTVANWLSSTGQIIPLTINGGGGADQIYVRQNSSFTVNDSSITSLAGLNLTMQAISYLELYNSTSGGSFTVNKWTHSDGLGLYLIGSMGNNIFNIGSGDLDTITAPVVVMATGGAANAITLNDENNGSFVDYFLTQSSLTSTQSVLQLGGQPRPFAGVSIGNFSSTTKTVIQSVNLNANPSGSVFNLTPSATTGFNIKGAPGLALGVANDLNMNLAAAQSPTLFLTNGASSFAAGGENAGLFMFANDKPVSFSNMAQTDFTGSVGAISAVSATAGAASLSSVNIINSVTGQILQSIPDVYGTSYTGGVQTALGDVNRDGIPDLVVAPGVGQAPLIKIYSILNGALLYQFMAQTATFNFGLRVAVGDVTGDGINDIITAPLLGPATVNVFANTGIATAPFTAYSTSTPTIKAFSNISGYQGGAGGLAVGNLDGHAATAKDPGGVDDIIVGSGIGTPAVAQVFNYFTNKTSSTIYTSIAPLFSASSVTGGLSVAVADVTGDGTPDLVMGAGTGAASQIDVYNGKTKAQNQFPAFTGTGNTAPLHVAIAKINGVNDILVAQGIGGQSHQIKTFTANGATVGAAFAETQSWLQGGINLD